MTLPLRIIIQDHLGIIKSIGFLATFPPSFRPNLIDEALGWTSPTDPPHHRNPQSCSTTHDTRALHSPAHGAGSLEPGAWGKEQAKATLPKCRHQGGCNGRPRSRRTHKGTTRSFVIPVHAKSKVALVPTLHTTPCLTLRYLTFSRSIHVDEKDVRRPTLGSPPLQQHQSLQSTCYRHHTLTSSFPPSLPLPRAAPPSSQIEKYAGSMASTTVLRFAQR